jgi:hypothetical protein
MRSDLSKRFSPDWLLFRARGAECLLHSIQVSIATMWALFHVVAPLVTHSLTSSHARALIGPLRQTRGVVC